MKYAIDRIENDVVIYQNLDTKEILECKKDSFPKDIKEGDIVAFLENKFIIDKDAANDRRRKLRDRLERLKSLK